MRGLKLKKISKLLSGVFESNTGINIVLTIFNEHPERYMKLSIANYMAPLIKTPLKTFPIPKIYILSEIKMNSL